MKKITWKLFFAALLRLGIGVAVIVGLLAWGMSNSKKHDDEYPWKGSVARVANDAKTTVDSKDFKTLESCRTWAKERLDALDLDSDNGSFTCGTGCTWNENVIRGGKQIKQYTCTELVSE